MFSLKALKCQSGGSGDEPTSVVAAVAPPSPTTTTVSRRTKLARRISRWKMESPVPEDVVPEEHELGIRTCVTTVNLVREDETGTLGITLRGAMPNDPDLSNHVVITQLKPDGPAFREGTIKPGDRLVAVNGTSLRGCTLAKAQAVLKQQAAVMALTIEYDVKTIDSALRRNGPLLVEIERHKGEDLGLTLHQTNDGVFIECIKRGSLSERCGALKEGDELLAVNNRRMDSVAMDNVEQVAQMLAEGVRLRLEILPLTSRPCHNPRTWNTRGKAEEPISPGSCGWYGTTSAAVTHSEKLHTTLIRDQSGFGLELCDTAHGTVIAVVQANSPAERSGCLYPGDRVLAVNHRSVALDMLTAEDATELVNTSPAGRLILHTEFDVLDTIVPASGIFNVRLIKRGASGLGLTITAEKEHEFAVCEVKKGSPAHRAGSLLPGDRLLAINGTPLDQCTAEQIAYILQQPEQVISLKVERTELTGNFGPVVVAVLQPEDNRMERKVTCTVELQRYGGAIGITIAGSEEGSQPITVSGLTRGGLAEQTGALLVGDQILAINEHSLIDEPLSTAHTLLQTSPDLVCLRISRSITPNGRVSNMSPIQPSSVDSAVESWASSHIDLTSSPDHCRPATGEKGYKPLAEWEAPASQLLDDITNENLHIQRELEMLSKEINQQTLDKQWQPTDVSDGHDHDHAINTTDKNGTNERSRSDFRNGEEYVHMQVIEKHGEERKEERESVVTEDNYPTTNLTDVSQWPYLNASQPSLRSEFKDHHLLTVQLLKDPVYEDFGFSVSDGLYERGVYINRIRKGGPADLSHCLCPFDRILQVNEVCTQDFDCCLTVPLIASSEDKLTLLVARPTCPNPTRSYSEQNLREERSPLLSYQTSSHSFSKIVV